MMPPLVPATTPLHYGLPLITGYLLGQMSRDGIDHPLDEPILLAALLDDLFALASLPAARWIAQTLEAPAPAGEVPL